MDIFGRYCEACLFEIRVGLSIKAEVELAKEVCVLKGSLTINVSIIIPVYNVQAYIERCLESILAQTYTDFEVICIDDGSTDESGKLCDVYQKRDSRIRVYHIENHGVSYARNYGLSLMEGAWYCFVDPDDWIEPNYIERMYRLAKEKQCDIVSCGIDKTYEFSMGIKEREEHIFTFGSSEECIRNYICGRNSMHGLVWNKLYNAEKFKEIRFEEKLKVNEDCMYIYEIMSCCEHACLTTMKLYHWYIRKDSACHRRAERADFSAAEVFLRLYDKLQGKDMEEARIVLQKNYVSSVVQVLLYAGYQKEDAVVELAKKRCKEWRKSVWKLLGIRQKLKYWYAISLRKAGC